MTTRKERGLDLAELTTVTNTERGDFASFYTDLLGHTHRGLDYMLAHDPGTLKRYRHYCGTVTPGNYESNRKLVAFGYLPFYALIGYNVGVRYLLRIRQKFGMTKEQIFSILGDRALSGPLGVHGGLSGAPNVVRYTVDGEWRQPPLLSKGSALRLQAGDVVELMSPGGGGYGQAKPE